MKKQKLVAALSAIIMTFGLTACDNTEETQGTVTETTVTEAVTTAEVTEAVTESPEVSPADKIAFEITDWSLDDMANNITLNGKKISLPCNVDDLGDDYKIGVVDEHYMGEYFIAELGYKDMYFAEVWLTLPEEEDKNWDIIGISALRVHESDMKIGDISFDSTREEVLEKYGESNFKSEQTSDKVVSYLFLSEDGSKLNQLLVTFDEYNDYKVESMKICLYEHGKKIK